MSDDDIIQAAADALSQTCSWCENKARPIRVGHHLPWAVAVVAAVRPLIQCESVREIHAIADQERIGLGMAMELFVAGVDGQHTDTDLGETP